MNWLILMFFSASAMFLFHLLYIGKTFPFEDFFHLGKQKEKKSHSGRDWVNREVECGGHTVFGQKVLNTQCGVGRSACKLPIMK